MPDNHAEHVMRHAQHISGRRIFIPIRRTFWEWLTRKPIRYRDITDEIVAHLQTHCRLQAVNHA